MEDGSETEEESIKMLSDYSHGVSKVASEHRHRGKIVLRRKLEQIRTDIKVNKELGLDPLLIFPEEIWIMILGEVADVEDLANLSKTCCLFKRLIGSEPVTLLFVKVLPMLSSKLEKKDILNSRLVCNKWSSGVDKFLESYFLINKPPLDIVDHLISGNEGPLIRMNKFDFWYKIADAKQQPRYYGQHYQIRTRAKGRQRNPFIGRSVRIMTQRPVTDVHIFSVFKKLFWEFGSHVWHLKLTDGDVSLSPASIYSLCLQSLISCQNIKSLCLGDWRHTKWSIPEEEQVNIFNAKPLPPNHPHLECLRISIKNPNIFLLQDKLVEKYSGQLKRLEVHYWNSEFYHNWNWDNLLELFIVQGNSVELLESLHQMTAPVLREVSICLDKSGPRLESIVQLTHHFPELDHLNLKFKDTFCGFSDQELLSLPQNLIASSTVSTLELIYSYSQIGFNFLICFPLVKDLIIKKGHHMSVDHYLYEGVMPRRHIDCSRIYLEDDPEFNFEQEYEDSDDEGEMGLNPGIGDGIGQDGQNDVNGDVGPLDAEDSDDEDGGNDQGEEDGSDREDDDDRDGNEDEDANEPNDIEGEEAGNEEEDEVEQNGNEDEEINLLELGEGGYRLPFGHMNREAPNAGNDSSSEEDGPIEPESETESNALSEDDLVRVSAKTNDRCLTSDFVKIAKYIPSAYNDHFDVRMYSSNIWNILPSLEAVKIYVPNASYYPAHNVYVYTRSGWLWKQSDYLTRISQPVQMVREKLIDQRGHIKENITRKLRNRRAAIADDLKAVGRDPLTLFSEEIWKLILHQLDDADDIADCGKVCPLFAKILKDTKQQWLFGQVFVFLYAKLDRKDILVCRQVCRKWCFAVDEFLQCYNMTDQGAKEDDQPYTGLEIEYTPYEFEYTFQFPHRPLSASGHDKVMNEMGRHNRSPFVGRTIVLSLGPSLDNKIGEFYGEFDSFLRTFGKHILHMKLTSANDESAPVVTPINYFLMILQILKTCRNLRSLTLSHVPVDWKSLKNKYDLFEQICLIEMPNHEYLESLAIHEANPKFMIIQETILQKYGSQLSRVDMELWDDDDDLCSNLFRRDLRELVLTVPKCKKWLGSYQGLTQTNNENLRSVQIRLDGHEPKLQHVMQLTNRCPKLERLCIEFTQTYPGFSNDELVHLSSDALLSPSSLQNLELTVASKWKVSMDFIISFPHLKRMSIRYVDKDDDVMDPIGLRESSYIHLTWAYPEYHPDNLDASHVYMSNIWDVLTRLEFLIFENIIPQVEPCRSKTFSRRGYEYFMKEK